MARCNKFVLLIGLVILLSSCKNEYLIDIEDVTELKEAILESEKYMKKIEVLPTYSNHYVEFGGLDLGRIDLIYSTLNYDPNDSIREGRKNPNLQKNVDILSCIPGLTSEEWQQLKCKLNVLSKYGIDSSWQAYYNDGKFQFYYYLYKFDKYLKIGPRAFLAVLSKEQVQSQDFNQCFIIMDQKDDLYLLISSDRN